MIRSGLKIGYLVKNDISGVANVFYGTRYVNDPSNNALRGQLSKSYSTIANQCGNLDGSVDGIINEDDPHYCNYKKSQFYQKDNPANKLNAFLWYYSTGRLEDNKIDNVKFNGGKPGSPEMNQMKNMACQIFQNKAVTIDISGDSTSGDDAECKSNNLFNQFSSCTVGNIFKGVENNKYVMIPVLVISTLFVLFGFTSFVKLAYKMFSIFDLQVGGLVLNIISIIVGYILAIIGGCLYIYYSVGIDTKNVPRDEYVLISPQSQTVESFQVQNHNMCKNGDSPAWGCCDDGVTHKIDPLGSNCCASDELNLDDSESEHLRSKLSTRVNSFNEMQRNVANAEESEETTTTTDDDEECTEKPYKSLGVDMYSLGENAGRFILFIIMMLLACVFFILLMIFYKIPLLGSIFGTLFVITCGLGICFLVGFITVDDVTGLFADRQLNTNMNIYKQSGTPNPLLVIPVGIVGTVLFIWAAYTLSGRGLFASIGKYLFLALASIFVVFMMMSFIIGWYMSPAFMGVSIIALRLLWNNILSAYTLGNKTQFKINLLSVMFEYPLQYFVNRFNIHSRNIFLLQGQQIIPTDTNNPPIPTGLPWDLPGVKIIKLLMTVMAKNRRGVVPNLIVDNYEKTVEYPSANVNVFSFAQLGTALRSIFTF